MILLSAECRTRSANLAARIDYVEIAHERDFSVVFADAMLLSPEGHDCIELALGGLREGQQINQIASVGGQEEDAAEAAHDTPARDHREGKPAADPNHDPEVDPAGETRTDRKRADDAGSARHEQRIEDVGAHQIPDGDVVVALERGNHTRD